MNRKSGKSLRESPKKGADNYVVCKTVIEKDNPGIQNDGCNKWICIGCLNTFGPQYDLWTKMVCMNHYGTV